MRCAFCSQSDSLTLEVPASETSAWRAVLRHLRSWSFAPRNLLHDVASVLFPANCRLCGDSLSRLSRAPICDHCWLGVVPQSGELCSCCSEDLRIASFSEFDPAVFGLADLRCQPCRLAAPPFERAVAYGGYTGSLRSLIHLLKYDGMLPVAEKLGAFLAEAVLKLDTEAAEGTAGFFAGALVVPVPLHASKHKERGFNHAELLARAAIRMLRARRPEWRLKLASGLLERKRATQSQSGLSPRQRRANLRGVFFAPAPERLAGRHVLLIDDIYTTGATARACSQALRRAGAVSVRVATVARPQRENFAAPQFLEEEPPMHQDVAYWGSRQGPPEHGKPTPRLSIAASRSL